MSGYHNIYIYQPPCNNVYDADGSLYRDSRQSCIRLQIEVSIRAVLTADAAATGDVNIVTSRTSRSGLVMANLAWQTALACVNACGRSTVDW